MPLWNLPFLGKQRPPAGKSVLGQPSFQETLPNDVGLDMVYIPDGRFLMGSPESELDRHEREGPQHPVQLPAFYLSKYPITQAQWAAIAQLPEIDRPLATHPAKFSGDRHPVEQVSWEEAVECCQRLAHYAGKPYRLPSEAEWEYACRAGTTAPFYFGATLSTDQANYAGNYTYNHGENGIYREQTSEVGIFPANAFGLHDMHGNVFEWCEDAWHKNYEQAPTDGRAWLEGGDVDLRLLRGGSWDYGPWSCRAAVRYYYPRVLRNDNIGFRVGCRLPSA